MAMRNAIEPNVEQDVPTPALASRDRALERAPLPFRACDRGAVDDGEQAAESEDEREDRLVRVGEREQRNDACPLACRRAGPIGGRTDREHDEHEQAHQQAERDPCRQATSQLADARYEEPQAAVPPPEGEAPFPAPPARPMNVPSPPTAGSPPVSLRNSRSRSSPDSRPVAQMPASPRARLTSPT